MSARRTPMLRASSLLAVSLLTGCAAMTQSECRHANWYERGRSDAYAGRSLGYLDKLAQSCAEHGLAPDRREYQRGHSAGLEAFCSPDRGYEFGRQGGRYAGTCPAHLAPPFLHAYRRGEATYQLQRQVDQIRREITRKERRLHKLAQRPPANDKQAARHNRAKQRHRLTDDLQRLHHELFHAEQQLFDAQARGGAG